MFCPNLKTIKEDRVYIGKDMREFNTEVIQWIEHEYEHERIVNENKKNKKNHNLFYTMKKQQTNQKNKIA